MELRNGAFLPLRRVLSACNTECCLNYLATARNSDFQSIGHILRERFSSGADAPQMAAVHTRFLADIIDGWN